LAFGEIGADGLCGGVSKWNVALLLAFAADEDGFVGPVNVGEIEAGELGVADAAAVEQLKNDRVAGGPGGSSLSESAESATESIESTDPVHLFDRRDAGQVLGQFGRSDQRGYILIDVAESGEPAKPTSHCGQGAGRGNFGEAAVVERSEPSADAVCSMDEAWCRDPGF
jgi:hypothetical protein